MNSRKVYKINQSYVISLPKSCIRRMQMIPKNVDVIEIDTHKKTFKLKLL
jgi:hypothetical protein